jgi:peptide chain release factor subunit 1
MSHTVVSSDDSADQAVFKKKVKELSGYKGRGTELISVYIPFGTDRSGVMNQLTTELGQSSNIKSPTTRKNVQSALRKISNFLKQINFKIPKMGMAVFAGNISEVEGKTDLKLFTVRAVKPLRTKLYWCDSSFHLDPLIEMLAPNDLYALIVMDKREATVALLSGKRYDIIGHFTSNVAGKFRAGGQSAARFERLREEAAHDFFVRTSEKINLALEGKYEKLNGIIVGGPGQTKHSFMETDALDYRIKNKVLGILDISYTDESGIRELIQKSGELLKNTELIKEKKTVEKFLEEVAKEGLATYGEKEVEKKLEEGKVGLLLISEGVEWRVAKMLCNGKVITQTIKEGNMDLSKTKCPDGSVPEETLEEIDYLDYMLEKSHEVGSKTIVISMDTEEGKQFFQSFGGIGAMLRYK